MRSSRSVLVASAVLAVLGLAACDGSAAPKPSARPSAPIAIATCATSVRVPPDTVRVVPSSSLPPTAVIRAGAALSLTLPTGSTAGFVAPVRPGSDAVLCQVSRSPSATVELVALHPGFVRVAVASAPGRQTIVNVQVTV